jgi:AbiV family abortive infection protein
MHTSSPTGERPRLSAVGATLAGMATMTGPEAREFWKALMENASCLVADARLLFEAESCGRARSLTVLAQEELGKALWIYDEFEAAWSCGLQDARTIERLREHGRRHVQKYLETARFGDELSAFWGDLSAFESRPGETPTEVIARLHTDGESRRAEAERAARGANIAKQHGFYVDRDEQGHVLSPSDIGPAEVEADLQRAAQVIEMLLIKDHTRMKNEAVTAYDSTRSQQFRLLPISHPDDWAAASEEFRSGLAAQDLRADD